MNYLPFYSVYLFPGLLFLSYYFQGGTTLIIPLIVGILLPILEVLCGDDKKEILESDRDDIRYNIPLWIWPFVQISYLLFFLCKISEWSNWVDFIFFSISVGIVNGGIGINVAHELIHKKEQIEKFLGKMLLCSVCYGHFYIEHIWGHHRHLASSKDSATAKIGETIYQFIPRSMTGSYKNAAKIGENKLLNPIYIFNCITLIYLTLVLIYISFSAFLFVIIQSLVSILMLESVQYIEHYGLRREEGDFVNPFHSWNTDKRITNYLTFKLQRHSDHHMNKNKNYQMLEYFDYAPQLPTGYTGTILLAYISPLWFRIMNPKLKAFNKKSH